MKIQRYNYGNKNKWIAPVCTIFALPLAWWFNGFATDGTSFEFKGFHVEAPNAAYIYWTFSGLMILAFLYAALKTYDLLTNREGRYIEVTERDITLPKMLGVGHDIYSFVDIKEIYALDYSGRRYIKLKTRYGRNYIGQKFFDNPQDFEDVLDLLAYKTGIALR